ncbi:MAG TPA: hypothetical protein VE442_18085 [Jatrophihabitans sp.]|jgi:hypothetical protein|nr:hypothetical protein [Jatrophihabitans sp.]
MTSTLNSDTAVLLRRAAQRAIRAPSVHNTQPWKFVVTDASLEIRADYSRQLAVLDPRGRQLMVSCGCALYNIRVAIAASGYEPLIHRFPEPGRREIVARVEVGGRRFVPGSTALDIAIDQRRTNRRAFGPHQIPSWLVTELQIAAREEETLLFAITHPRHREAIVRLTVQADHFERSDPAYLAEIAAWTTDDPRRPDGVQAASVPYAGALADEHERLPIRGFDVRGMGWLPASSGSNPGETLLLLCSHDDQPRGWLRTGEALEHVWLKLTDRGYWASPLTQVIEVRDTHDQLRNELALVAEPQLLLRVGRAPETVRTPRRPAHEVIIDRRKSSGGHRH